jgi:hypothetical protein
VLNSEEKQALGRTEFRPEPVDVLPGELEGNSTPLSRRQGKSAEKNVVLPPLGVVLRAAIHGHAGDIHGLQTLIN